MGFYRPPSIIILFIIVFWILGFLWVFFLSSILNVYSKLLLLKFFVLICFLILLFKTLCALFVHAPFWMEYGSSDGLFILLLFHTATNSHSEATFLDCGSVLIKHLS